MPTVEELPAAASRVEMTQMVLPPDTNMHGTLFGGRLLQWIDICGAIAAQRHCRTKVVTASMDDMHFSVPIQEGDVVILWATVNYVHRSSMEVGVRVEREAPLTGERVHAATSYLTYVALDESGKPHPIPKVRAETPGERRRYNDAITRREFRLARRAAMDARQALEGEG